MNTRPFLLLGLKSWLRTRYLAADSHFRIKNRFLLWPLCSYAPKVDETEVSFGDVTGVDVKNLKRKWLWPFSEVGDVVLRGRDSHQIAFTDVYAPKALKVEIDRIRTASAEEEEAQSEEQSCEETDWRESAGEDDFADYAFWFPHFPKAICRLLAAREPEVYAKRGLEFSLSAGDFVSEGQVIGRFGDIEVTAPFDGTLTFVGGNKVGIADWFHGRQIAWDPDVDPQVAVVKKLSDGEGGFPTEIEFEESLSEDECYLFALAPHIERSKIPDDAWIGINRAFDGGRTHRSDNQLTPYTFATLIDKTVQRIKSSSGNHGLPLPDALSTDEEFERLLVGYWQRITNGTATVKQRTDR